MRKIIQSGLLWSCLSDLSNNTIILTGMGKIPLCKQIYNLENVHKINLKVSISLMELHLLKCQIPNFFLKLIFLNGINGNQL